MTVGELRARLQGLPGNARVALGHKCADHVNPDFEIRVGWDDFGNAVVALEEQDARLQKLFSITPA